MTMPGSESEKPFVLARKVFYPSAPPKHEKGAICKANQRSSNVCRIVGAAKLRSNSKASSKKLKQPGSESEKPFVLARKGF